MSSTVETSVTGAATSVIEPVVLKRQSGKQEPRFMNSTSGDEISRLKAEIRRLQQALRRMSTVDVSRVRSNNKGPSILPISEDSCGSGLFDSDEEADLVSSDNRLIEEYLKLKEENENLRIEIESLKELCEARKSRPGSLSKEDLRLVEGEEASRLLLKQNEVIASLKAAIEEKDLSLTLAMQKISSLELEGQEVQYSTTSTTVGRPRSTLDDAIAADAIVNGGRTSSDANRSFLSTS